jgi:signal transduction histidine kinase
VQINIRDDGTGAEKIEEGIGIMGMRERMAKVSGSLAAHGVADGFLVSARIPLDRAY